MKFTSANPNRFLEGQLPMESGTPHAGPAARLGLRRGADFRLCRLDILMAGLRSGTRIEGPETHRFLVPSAIRFQKGVLDLSLLA